MTCCSLQHVIASNPPLGAGISATNTVENAPCPYSATAWFVTCDPDWSGAEESIPATSAEPERARRRFRSSGSVPKSFHIILGRFNSVERRRDPTGPSQATIKRLFAHSGNRCAFPRCTAALIEGHTVVGEICHIKGAKSGAPRYDAQQTPAERHDYDNLILLCSKHHTVVDDDEVAYTVERLLKMKDEHEKVATKLDDTFANQATQFLISKSAVSENQSGGITAHTITNSFNETYNPYQRPPLDITPSSVTKIFPLWSSLFTVSFGALSFVSIILTIIGKNIFQLKDYMPHSLVNYIWILGIPFLLIAALFFIFAICLKIYGAFRLFSHIWAVIDNKIISIQLRRTCPFSECGGDMEVMVTRTGGRGWVCKRNRRLHIVQYDDTQVDSAMEKGQLTSKIRAVIGEVE